MVERSSLQMAVVFSGQTPGAADSKTGAHRTISPDLGGKATALVSLERTGVSVPKWFCVPASVFTAAHAAVRAELGGADGAALAGSDRTKIREVAERARACARAASMDETIRAMIEGAFDAIFPADARVAVRSSALGEDSERDSFAGQLDTYLYVARQDLLARVADCVASAYTERALVYRERRGLAGMPVRVAVIVQQMIHSRASGVLFTANPTTCDRTEAVISAGLGLGEGIVTGRVETDTWLMTLSDATVRHRTIVEKHSRVAFDGHAGTRVEDVTGCESKASVLTDDGARALVTLARGIEEHFGAPQDIEWAIDPSGSIHILQSRPITTLERETIFDSSNIVESFPGLSSPLTFSFARASYEVAFREAQIRTGMPVSILDENRHVHANLIGLVNGRIYYNILNWYRLFTWIPGFEGMLPAWEKALGIDQRFTRPPQRVKLTFPQRLAYGRVVRTTVRAFWTLQREVDAYVAELAIVQREVAARDLDALDAHELLEVLETTTRRLLAPYAISVLNDLFTQQLYEGLAKLIAAWKLGDPTTLRNELLCGERGVESVAPARALVAVARRVRETPALAAAFATMDDAALVSALSREAELTALKEAIEEHLRVYGDRTIEELKLETPPLRERPGFLIGMIRNYVRGGQDVGSMERHEAEIRARAEKEVAGKLAGHPVRRWLFDLVVSGSRRTIKNRENLRLARSRAYGIVRSIYRALARKLVSRKLLEAEADVFFMTVQEVEGAVRGSSPTQDLRALVALRKEEYAEFARAQPAPRVSVRGIVHGVEVAETGGESSAATGATLRGVACSPGRRTAKAKVVLLAEEENDLRGEILIAPMTDPAWVYLMVAAGGLVAERGSVLSHTAIIGRELGIPTVVGVAGATRVIASGQMVEIDGTTGTVRVLADAELKN